MSQKTAAPLHHSAFAQERLEHSELMQICCESCKCHWAECRFSYGSRSLVLSDGLPVVGREAHAGLVQLVLDLRVGLYLLVSNCVEQAYAHLSKQIALT